VIEQAEILEYDADALAKSGQGLALHRRNIGAEQRNQTPGRAQREKEQAQQAGLAGTRRSGEKMKRAPRDVERNVAQHFRPHAVAQPHIFKSDHGFERLCCPDLYL